VSASTESLSVHMAREAVSLATLMNGRKRGWHLVAQLLGVSERVVKALTYGEPARVDPIAAQQARNTLARERIQQIRAELALLEGAAEHAESPVVSSRQNHGCAR